MNPENQSREPSFWRTKSGIALCAFIAIAALFLVLEHRAHALQWLPFALLLACPLLHLFMHRGHSHGDAAKRDRDADGPGPHRH